ncbi:MAG: DNA mismatch repair endonuclease MutL, partial [Clostridiales bacterium]|nr:DNA mismatch repair endonuclease MutL [Candidatus Apopatocola equi]
MPQINILSAHVADLIAAGEVVEKPANAVKELLENCFDAGARSVTVEIRGGGREYIRITDDGCGMSPEDAGICFLRHATSKLSDERGLEAIGTMGFRGEALAAISSVSRMVLTTRRHGSPNGVRVELTAGEIDSMGEVGCREGTVIEVRDLFYNTPARLKFLGTDRAEGLACVQTALRSAMGRPEISVRCIRDGAEQFFTPGDGKQESCVYALLGRETALDFLRVDAQGDGVSCTGFISAPEHCRGNRTAQFFFCNGRPIRSQKLSAALEQAYKNAAMVGKFPACVLYLTLNPAAGGGDGPPPKAAGGG